MTVRVCDICDIAECRAHAPAKVEEKTLRDEFAMAAMQGMLAEPQNPSCYAGECDWVRVISARAYEYADAMMEARKK